MIWREGFVYERFTLTKPIVEGGLERIGDLIIGLPQGQFPQFELCDKGKDWQQILGQVLTREELEELGRRFGCKIGEGIRFWPPMVLDFWTTVETTPTFESKSGKRFWVFKIRVS
jgi:hypothetical protein